MTKSEKSDNKKSDDKVLHFDSTNWKSEVLDAKVPVLVDFTATWCGPCKTMTPVLAKLAAEREDVKFGKLDIDECEELTDQYRVEGVPTFLVFVKGEVVGQSVGSCPKKDMDAFLDRAIGGQRPGMPKEKKRGK